MFIAISLDHFRLMDIEKHVSDEVKYFKKAFLFFIIALV